MTVEWWTVVLAGAVHTAAVATVWINTNARTRLAAEKVRARSLRQIARDLPAGSNFREQRRDGSVIVLSRRSVTAEPKLPKRGGRSG